ncbi:MAG: type II toxin-antitoxin system RelE/ParE family toxin [Gemmatimonadaceae bacterium]
MAATAARALRKLEPAVRLQVSRKIDALAQDPRPAGVKKLEGEADIYRVRVGNFRIIYRIENRKLLILVLLVGDRKDVYRR